MTRRAAVALLFLLVTGFVVLFTSLAPAAVAGGAKDVGMPTRLVLDASSSTVSGHPVGVEVRLLDERGKPVGGALIRLLEVTSFMGKQREVIVDEARTDEGGGADLTFSSADRGRVEAVARFAGGSGYAPAESRASFDVLIPVITYRKAPLGVGGRWARAYLILVPVIAVWITYVSVLLLARRVWRTGPRRARVVTSLMQESVPLE